VRGITAAQTGFQKLLAGQEKAATEPGLQADSPDDSAAVAIVRGDGTVAGIATWKPRGFPAGVTYEIGVAVAPEHRGQAIGTAAQELLVEYLLDYTTAHRIEALTEESNAAEAGNGHALAQVRWVLGR
jgi:RimJ/RimL family protein N-acetyltransferase